MQLSNLALCRSRERRLRTEFITEFTSGGGRAKGGSAAGADHAGTSGRILDALPGYDPAVMGGTVPLPKSAMEVQGIRCGTSQHFSALAFEYLR